MIKCFWIKDENKIRTSVPDPKWKTIGPYEEGVFLTNQDLDELKAEYWDAARLYGMDYEQVEFDWSSVEEYEASKEKK